MVCGVKALLKFPSVELPLFQNDSAACLPFPFFWLAWTNTEKMEPDIGKRDRRERADGEADGEGDGKGTEKPAASQVHFS